MQHIDLDPPYRLVFGRHGPCLVNVKDTYVGNAIATYGEYGEIECQHIASLVDTGRDAAEIGANMGSHTIPIAKLLAPKRRRLLAVEPQPVVFQNMCANVALARLMNVQAENCACAAEPGWLSFDAPDYTGEGNFGGVSMKQSGPGTRVRSVPLDDLIDDSWDLGFLKIDVEGFERLVIEGARKTIARCRPAIYVENDRVEKSRELIECLWAAGYKLWYDCPPLFNPGNFARVTENKYPNVVSVNMIALPREMNADVGFPPISDAGAHPMKR